MSIEITCACGKRYRVTDTMAGKKVRCTNCQRSLVVPSPQVETGLDPLDEYALAGAAADEVRAQVDPAPDVLTRIVVNPNSFASNPGRAKLDVLHYLRCRSTPLTIAGIIFIVGLLAITVDPLAALLGAAALLVMVGIDVLNARAKFRSGDVNPAVVIGVKPTRVAFYADMSTGNGKVYPAVQIQRNNLRSMTGGAPKVGQRLAAVSLYHGKAGQPAWANFNPTIINTAAKSPAVIDRMFSSIPHREWQALDRAVGSLKEPKPGMYKLWLGTKNQNLSQPVQLVLAALLLAVMVLPIGSAVMKKWKSGGSEAEVTSSEAVDPPRPNVRALPPKAIVPPSAYTLPRKEVRSSQPPQTLSGPTSPDAHATSAPALAEQAKTPIRRKGTPPVGRPATVRPLVAGETESARTADKIEANDHGMWRVCSIRKRDGQRAFIHWDGWGDSWDEWVGPDRMRPLSQK